MSDVSRPCKLCGAPLRILKTRKGKTVALDLRARCYQVQIGERGMIAVPVASWVSVKDVYVDHTTLCPKYSTNPVESPANPSQT